MINFFYHPGYTKRRKKIFTIKLHESVIVNKLIDFTYYFNLTFPNRFITNGTHKCMNNTLRALKQNTKSFYNKDVHPNSYILQFDWFGEKILNQLLKNKIDNKKIIIGPLYTDEQLKRLSNYLENYKFIKILAASSFSAEQILKNENLNIKEENICVIPTGIISEKKLKNFKKRTRNENCLIYFKNREEQDLQKATKFLISKNIPYKLFKYGTYSNNDLINEARKSKFCVLINGSESQGIAVQEILMTNLPIFVWNVKSADLNNIASSTPYFDDRCGMIVGNFNEFINNFDNFVNNLNYYEPRRIILDKMTFEKFVNNLQKHF